MNLNKKRRQKNKTNYAKRLNLLRGNAPRLVIRKTNKYVTLQVVEHKDAQDYIIEAVTTRDLLKNGWPEAKKGSLKSLSASYLAGLLLGNKLKGKIKQKLILDLGLIPNTKGSRVYSAVKGISDAGIKIDFNEEIMPSQERINGKFMKSDFSDTFKKIKEKINGK
jgi:large subunit ribosomal protein L18